MVEIGSIKKRIKYFAFAGVFNVIFFFCLVIFGSPAKWVGLAYKSGFDRIISTIFLKYINNAYMINIVCLIVLLGLYMKIRKYVGVRYKFVFFLICAVILALSFLLYVLAIAR